MDRIDSATPSPSPELKRVLSGGSGGVTPPVAARVAASPAVAQLRASPVSPNRSSPVVFAGRDQRSVIFAHEFGALSPEIKARLTRRFTQGPLPKPLATRPAEDGAGPAVQ